MNLLVETPNETDASTKISARLKIGRNKAYLPQPLENLLEQRPSMIRKREKSPKINRIGQNRAEQRTNPTFLCPPNKYVIIPAFDDPRIINSEAIAIQ
jgi:hypothetical protein